MKRFLGALAIIAITFTAQPAGAAQPKYKNCAALLKVHSTGIATSAKSVNKGAGPIEQAKISSALYAANKALDTDKDGIACEVVIKAAPVSPVITLDNLNATGTKDVAQQAIVVAITRSPVVSESVLVVRKGPSLVPADYALPKKSLLTSISLFSSIHNPTSINVNWFSGQDWSWVDNAITDSGGNPNSTPIGQPYSVWVKSVASFCNMGSASIGSKGPYFNQCLLSNSPEYLASDTASHEYFHTVQFALLGYNMPVWFMEGSATFVGIHVGGRVLGDFSKTRNLALSRYASEGVDQALIDAVASGDNNFIINRLKQLETAKPNSDIRESAIRSEC